MGKLTFCKPMKIEGMNELVVVGKDCMKKISGVIKTKKAPKRMMGITSGAFLLLNN